MNPSTAENGSPFFSFEKALKSRLVVFYGLGNGDLLSAFLERQILPSQRIVVVEKNPDLHSAWLSRQDSEASLIQWFVGLDPQSFKVQACRFFFRDVGALISVGSVENVFCEESLKSDGAYYVECGRFFHEAAEEITISTMADPEDTFRGLLNVTANLPLLDKNPLFDELAGLFKNRPGIVISTGPSLNQSLDLLKKVSNRAVLVAVDSAAPVLIDHDIKPHLIATLERVPDTQKIVAAIRPQQGSWLVANPLAHPKTLASYPDDPLFLLSTSLFWEMLFPGKSSYDLGLSSANMACMMLEILGCNPVILLGQDLAFHPETGVSHASGSHPFLGDLGKSIRDRTREKASNENWVEGNSGKPIFTWEAYRLIANWFERRAISSPKKRMNAIPQNFGMKMKGWERLDPEDIFTESLGPVFDASQVIKEKISRASSRELLPKARALKDALNLLSEDALGLWEEVSLFYHENFPSLPDASLWKKYRLQFAALEKRINERFLSQDVLRHFLWPFVHHSYVQLFRKYYRFLDDETLKLRERMDGGIRVLENWLRLLAVWSSRTARLFP